MAHKKILFRLTQDEDGYPPFAVEGVWANELGNGMFIIDNIPFFARQAALEDAVEVENIDGELFYRQAHARSGNSLLRVILLGQSDGSQLRSALEGLGCSTELGYRKKLIAINVPPEVSLAQVKDLLDEGCNKESWDSEEPIIRQ
jgi:hypothetical protein